MKCVDKVVDCFDDVAISVALKSHTRLSHHGCFRCPGPRRNLTPQSTSLSSLSYLKMSAVDNVEKPAGSAVANKSFRTSVIGLYDSLHR